MVVKTSKTSAWSFASQILFVANLALAQTPLPPSKPPAEAQSNKATATVSPNPVAATAGSEQKTAVVPAIGTGDLLKLSILGAPESDQEVRVAADGNISVHFLGRVQVAGLTVEQAEAEITKKLVDGGFFTNPQVSVFVKEYPTEGVSVLGEVKNPGVYPVIGSRRLFDVLSLAGGTTEKAGNLVSLSHRNSPQQPITLRLSNDPVLGATSNVEILPGDTVMVPKAGIVYVEGDVRKPTGVLMTDGKMTVLQAISLAEGTGPNAALNKAVLIRNTADGRKEIPLALKKMLSAKASDMTLQAEDIIFVPDSAAQSAAKRSMEAIVQTAVGLAIYHPY